MTESPEDGRGFWRRLRDSSQSHIRRFFDSFEPDRIIARLERWEEFTDRLFERWQAITWRVEKRVRRLSEADSPGPWLLTVLGAAGVGAVLFGFLHVLLVLLGSDSWPGWLGVGIVGAVAVGLLRAVFNRLLISIAEPSNRLAVSKALLYSFAAALTTVEAFAALVARLGWLDLRQAENALSWHLANAIPFLDIAGRLGWAAPTLPDSPAGQVMRLTFTLAVIPPLVRLAVAVYQVVDEASETQRATAETLRRRGVSYRGAYRYLTLVPWVGAAGFTWGATGPGTLIGQSINDSSRITVADIEAIVGSFAVVAGALFLAGWAVIEAWEFVWLTAPVVAIATLWIALVRHAVLPVADPLSTGNRVMLTVGLIVLFFLLAASSYGYVPPLGAALLTIAVVVGFLGDAPPATAWIAEAARWEPWRIEVGAGLIKAALWAGVVFVAITILDLIYYTRRRNTQTNPGSILLEGLSVTAMVIAGAAALLVTLQAVGWMPLADGETRASAATAFIGLAWHVVDSIPAANIPTILDWRVAHDLTGPGMGPFILGLVLVLIVTVGFAVLGNLLAWGRSRALSAGVSVRKTTGDLLADLRLALDMLARKDDQPSSTNLWSSRLRGQSDWAYQLDQILRRAAVGYQRVSRLLGSASPTARAAKVAIARTLAAWTSGPEEAELRRGAIEAVEAYARHVDLWSEHLRAVARLPSVPTTHDDLEPFRGFWFRAGPDMYVSGPRWADAEAEIDATMEGDGAATADESNEDRDDIRLRSG